VRPGVEPLPARALATVALDPTFGVNGIAVAALGGAATVLNALALQPDGKVVAVGYTTDPGPPSSRWVVMRFTAAGRLDPTFGQGGVVTTLFTGGQAGGDHADSVLVEPGGTILVGGGIGAGYAAVARYNPDGTLAYDFGTAGRVTGSVYALATARGLAEAGGRILVTGPSASSVSRPLTVVRLNPDGTADPGFGVNGVAVSALNDATLAVDASAVAEEADGTVVAAGTVQAGAGHAVIARFAPNGVLIGEAVTDFGTGLGDGFAALAVQPDGKVVAAGTTRVAVAAGAPVASFALARYNPDLSADTAFGNLGKVITPVGGLGAGAASVAVQADGRIVAAGGTATPGLTVVRYTAGGLPDPTFGPGGLVSVPLGPPATATALLVQPGDGKVVVGGTTPVSGGPVVLALARLAPFPGATAPAAVPAPATSPARSPRPVLARRPVPPPRHARLPAPRPVRPAASLLRRPHAR
jgi:uncharacterized delta-60 repeat protein